jgi:hypothetical protein
VNLDTRGHFQVRIDAGYKSGLFLQLAMGARRDAIKHISDIEHIEVENGRRDP